MIPIEKFLASVEAFPVASQARISFFIELGQAAEFHEVETRAAALIFNPSGNGNDAARGPQGDTLVGNGLVDEKAGDESECH